MCLIPILLTTSNPSCPFAAVCLSVTANIQFCTSVLALQLVWPVFIDILSPFLYDFTCFTFARNVSWIYVLISLCVYRQEKKKTVSFLHHLSLSPSLLYFHSCCLFDIHWILRLYRLNIVLLWLGTRVVFWWGYPLFRTDWGGNIAASPTSTVHSLTFSPGRRNLYTDCMSYYMLKANNRSWPTTLE